MVTLITIQKKNSNNLMYFEHFILYAEGQDNQQTRHKYEVEAALHQKKKYTHTQKNPPEVS